MLLRVAIGAGMGQVGIDRLTGLPNRRWFLDEADRHIDRLDLDGVVGTLVLIDIDDLRSVNLALGRAQGDRVLVRMASQLRAMVRPSDVVARVGADEFALWQDGMDHLTAAERAEALCSRSLFQDLPDGIRPDIFHRHRQPPAGQRRGCPHHCCDARTWRREMSKPKAAAAGASRFRPSGSRCSDLRRRRSAWGRPGSRHGRKGDEKTDRRHRICIRCLPGSPSRLTITQMMSVQAPTALDSRRPMTAKRVAAGCTALRRSRVRTGFRRAGSGHQQLPDAGRHALGDGFRVLDSFSRIVRLGEGLHSTGR